MRILERLLHRFRIFINWLKYAGRPGFAQGGVIHPGCPLTEEELLILRTMEADALVAYGKRIRGYRWLRDCYKSGQMSEAAWQGHLNDDYLFRAWVLRTEREKVESE